MCTVMMHFRVAQDMQRWGTPGVVAQHRDPFKDPQSQPEPPILQRAAIGKILTHLGLDPRPPPRGRASEAGHAFAAD